MFWQLIGGVDVDLIVATRDVYDLFELLKRRGLDLELKTKRYYFNDPNSLLDMVPLSWHALWAELFKNGLTLLRGCPLHYIDDTKPQEIHVFDSHGLNHIALY
jgi:hypothetical protein